MYTVCNVRDLELYSGKKPGEIWAFYKRNLGLVLDRIDGVRSNTPAMRAMEERPAA
jgi:hypothetical protein